MPEVSFCVRNNFYEILSIIVYYRELAYRQKDTAHISAYKQAVLKSKCRIIKKFCQDKMKISAKFIDTYVYVTPGVIHIRHVYVYAKNI